MTTTFKPFKVTIVVGTNSVIFQASAPISESRTANYDGYNIVHLPTDIFSYRNTSGRRFGITAKLVSRTPNEAGANSRYVDLIRSWVLPNFGGRGATPPIVKLSAFQNQNLQDVPCIIKSYTMNYPDDVDWITSGPEGSAMPVITTITLELDEAYSPLQITGRAWKIIPYAGIGSFVGGSAPDDVTSAAGGQSTWLTSTPPLQTLASDSSFQGLASSLGYNTASPIITTAGSNGNLADTLGITNSSLVTDQTKTNNMMINGLNLESARQTTVQQTPPPLPNPTQTVDPFKKITFTVNNITSAT